MQKDNNQEIEAGANVLIRGHKCFRCGHEWKPNNLNEVPRVCPKCKNPYWDRPKKTDTKKPAQHLHGSAQHLHGSA